MNPAPVKVESRLSEILNRRGEVARLCRRFGVRRLEVFGSVVTRPDRAPNDLDFLVDLGELPPRQYSEAYFALRESLEELFAHPVDLLTPENLANPYFRERVEREKQLLYAA